MTQIATLILAIVPIVPLASFAWAMHAHFGGHGRVPRPMRLLALCSLVAYGCYGACLWARSAPPGPASGLAGAVLFASATALFWWAVAASRRARLGLAHAPHGSTGIVSSGPFGWVRHPFYLSYMLFWFGTALVAGGWQWVPVLGLVGWYAGLAASEERRLLRGETALRYAAYRRRTGMFVPALWIRPS